MDGAPFTVTNIFIHNQVHYAMVCFYEGSTLDHIKAICKSHDELDESMGYHKLVEILEEQHHQDLENDTYWQFK